MNDGPKIPGCCSLCDAGVYEIKQRFPREHVLAGRPRGSVGRVLDGACRGTYLLADGSRADMTLCVDCVAQAAEPENLVKVWRKAILAFGLEERHYLDLSPKQQPRSMRAQAQVRKSLVRMRENVPLALVAVMDADRMRGLALGSRHG